MGTREGPAALYAGHPPALPLSRRVLLGGALASGALWLAAERWGGRLLHPRFPEMQAAAHAMQGAMAVIREEKERRGLMQPPAVDPNRTGLIGPEWSETTTTQGLLAAKRTATNPDSAAAFVRMLDQLALPHRATALVVLSGSLVGANIAAVAAVEALGLRPMVISSLGASMYGATDLALTWLDIEAALTARRILSARSLVAVLGAEGGIGRGLDSVGVAALRASAERNRVPVAEASSLSDLVEDLLARVVAATGAPVGPRVLINVGGSVVGLGACDEAEAYPPGLITKPQPCGGTPGLVSLFSARGVPVLHILNMRRLAADLALPYDPVPLPRPGENWRIYGGAGVP